MSIKRIVSTAFWQDPDVLDKYSIEDQQFFLYLLTNPRSKLCGIYILPRRYISFEAKHTEKAAEELLNRFQTVYKNIIYNSETQEVAVLNALKYGIISGGPVVENLIRKELNEIKDSRLITAVYHNMLDFWMAPTARPVDGKIKLIFEEEIDSRNNKPNGDAYAYGYEYEYEYEYEYDHSRPESNNESSPESRHESKKEPKGDAGNEPVFIRIILNDNTYHDVLKKDVERYKELYPDVTVEQSLRNMAGWSESNLNKRKTKRGVKTFITNWLIRDQEKAEKEKKDRKASTIPDRNRIKDDSEYDHPTNINHNPFFQAHMEKIRKGD